MVLKTITFYTFSNYINIFLSFVQGFFLVKILSLSQMGEFSQFKIILNYLLLFNLGLTNSFFILLPKSSSDERKIFKNQIFTINTIIFIIVSFLFLSFFLIYKEEIFLFIFLVLLFYSSKEIPSYYLRSVGDFSKYSVNLILSQTVLLLSTIFLAYLFGLKGAYFSYLFYSIFSFFFGIFLIKGIRFSNFNIENFKFFIKKGFNIYFVGFLNQIISNFERLFLSFILMKETFAIYSTAVFFLSFVQMLPVSIIQFFLPDFVKNIEGYSQKKINIFFIVISTITFFLIILSYLFLKIITGSILQNYIGSVKIFLILSITIFYDIFFYLMFNKLLSLEKLKYYNYIQIAGSFIVFLGVLLFYLIKRDVDIVEFSYYFLILKTLYFFIWVMFLKVFLNMSLNFLSFIMIFLYTFIIIIFEKINLYLSFGLILFFSAILIFSVKKLTLLMKEE
ncbi:MAG: oligosaccharide flippase family protein [bacterium]|nr:oligosaccharide flippase family protein [bacterium]